MSLIELLQLCYSRKWMTNNNTLNQIICEIKILFYFIGKIFSIYSENMLHINVCLTMVVITGNFFFFHRKYLETPLIYVIIIVIMI